MENISSIKVRSLYKKITFYFYEKIGNYFLANPIYFSEMLTFQDGNYTVELQHLKNQ